ncbi:hypothetical protein VTN00DRAFT_7019 [Thermoascus crustaceus]|uniref:uncharacterized protein n=1 Tax=Thermoascus crustaceus TaxID=5088 RepID=UPI003742308E
MATNTNAKVAANHLGPEHLEAFDQTLRRILSTDLTGYTLAQIVDGLPTRDVYYDYANYHAKIDNHVEPKPESVEMVNTLQENFRPDALHVDSEFGLFLLPTCL